MYKPPASLEVFTSTNELFYHDSVLSSLQEAENHLLRQCNKLATHIWLDNTLYMQLATDPVVWEMITKTRGIKVIPMRNFECIIAANIPDEGDYTYLPFVGYPSEYIKNNPKYAVVLFPGCYRDVVHHWNMTELNI